MKVFEIVFLYYYYSKLVVILFLGGIIEVNVIIKDMKYVGVMIFYLILLYDV